MGCRLHIKGQEIFLRYLFDKATGRSDGGGVPECDLYGEQEPWEIWEAYGHGTNLRENKNALYLFTKSKKKSAKDSRLDRTVGAGSWKGEDTGTKIYLKERSGIVTTLVGMRKRFHYESKNGCLHDGRWIMHEYSLDAATLVNAKFQDYMLCRITKMDEYQKRRRSSGKRKSTSSAEIKDGNGESMEPEHVSKKISQVVSPTCNGNSNSRIPAAETAVARNIPSKEVDIAAADDDTCKFQREDHDPIIIDLSDGAPDVEDAGEANNNNNNTGTGLVAGAEQILIINSHEDDQYYSPMGISFNCSGILVGTPGPGAALNELSDPISTGRTDEYRNDEAQSLSEELTRDQAQPLTEETQIEMFPNLLFLENWTNGCELLYN